MLEDHMTTGRISGAVLQRNEYLDGEHLQKNPTWYVEESPFKVKQIMRMVRRHDLRPKTVCEAGCGAGEVLRLLQEQMEPGCRFVGYEISPQAFELSRTRQNDGLQFRLGDIAQDSKSFFDLMLVLDVVEHLEDYYGFLNAIRGRSVHKIFHFPLDLSVQAVARGRGLLKRRE